MEITKKQLMNRIEQLVDGAESVILSTDNGILVTGDGTEIFITLAKVISVIKNYVGKEKMEKVLNVALLDEVGLKTLKGMLDKEGK